MRSRILGQSVAPTAGIDFYSQTNAAFFTLLEQLPKLSDAGKLNNTASAYIAFLQSKERAGIERAVLANAFAADRFAPEFYDKFRSLVTTQDVYTKVFTSLASKEHLEFYNSTLQGQAINETQRMRQVASSRANQGGFGIDPNQWFRLQTEKINLLKQVENKLAADLEADSTTLGGTANQALIGLSVVAALTFGFACVVSLFTIKGLLYQLGADPNRLAEAVNAVAAGDLEMNLGDRQKHRGVLADVQKMQDQLRERRKNDAANMEANVRIKDALDNVDGHVMVSDEDLNIVFINQSLNEIFEGEATAFNQALGSFDPHNLLGTPMHKLHPNPSEFSSLLETIAHSRKLDFEIADRSYRVIANPVRDDSGERIGVVLEWFDRTAELAIEAEVENVVDRAKAGDLDGRIRTDDKEGFHARLSLSINELVDMAERVIADTVRVLSSMAVGELNKTIETDYEGSFQQLKTDANTTVEKLTSVVGNIQSAATTVKTGADEISQGNNHLSQRTEEQAASLEETASSMEEMTSTVKQNADNAAQANELARAARRQAEKGGTVVNEAVAAMQAINNSSKQISDIIGVIDEIAFQTNLLALNASVEAARAGEQGRGFAVVASEVRNLAGRSATAAKEIKELIEDSGEKVTEGSRLVDESGEMLNQIVDGVKEVTDIVGEISAASQEQSIGIDQVNKAISQMDELTQQNAALVEQAASASEALGEQADELNQMMSFFTIDHRVNAASTQPQEDYQGPERRSADRPWSGDKTAAMEPQTTTAAPAANAVGSDQHWEEF